jgi:hypothetical protein
MSQQPIPEKKKLLSQEVEQIFGDFEARQNIIALYELAYKVDRRINSHLYDEEQPQKKHHD